MRIASVAMAALLAAVAVNAGYAQVYQRPPEVEPAVTAGSAEWQLRGDPVFFAGDYYDAAGASVFFDRQVMVRSGVFRGVPVYVDATLEPFSLVYVPIGRNLMRPYERRREGQLAGTEGSRPPSFPIERDVEASVAAGDGSPGAPRAAETALERQAVPLSQVDDASDVTASSLPDEVSSRTRAGGGRASARTAVESVPAPRSNLGIWLQFDDERWYSAGPAVSYAAGEFTSIGRYRGLEVYRKRGGSDREIYVPSVQEGPLAPYRRR